MVICIYAVDTIESFNANAVDILLARESGTEVIYYDQSRGLQLITHEDIV